MAFFFENIAMYIIVWNIEANQTCKVSFIKCMVSIFWDKLQKCLFQVLPCQSLYFFYGGFASYSMPELCLGPTGEITTPLRPLEFQLYLTYLQRVERLPFWDVEGSNTFHYHFSKSIRMIHTFDFWFKLWKYTNLQKNTSEGAPILYFTIMEQFFLWNVIISQKSLHSKNYIITII